MDVMAFKICCAQLNFVVGDVVENARKIVAAARAAHAAGADLLLTPELALAGGPGAHDLFLRPAFIEACAVALQTVVGESAALDGLTIVVGHPKAGAGATAGAARLRNAWSAIQGGAVVAQHAKSLPFDARAADEARYFQLDVADACVFDCGGVRVGLLAEDEGAQPDRVAALKAAGVELLALSGASGFFEGSAIARDGVMTAACRASSLPLVYANLVGGQDDCVYEGRSGAFDAHGAHVGCAPAFEAQLFDVQVERADAALKLTAERAALREPVADLWHALVLAIRDYTHKSGFTGVALGLSGGIDSAVVMTLAVDALGAANVRVLLMPSAYTADMSGEDAGALADHLGVRHDMVAISPVFERFKATLAPLFEGRAEDTTEENLQARIRGVLLMALSNKYGLLILETGNKSELAAGYATLYGDMCGGFAPISDVLKTRVYELARWRNRDDPFGSGANPIPARIIARPPSAELRPGQTDQDSLPSYDMLDAIVQRIVEDNAGAAQLVREGFDAAAVERVVHLIKNSEYKRGQAVIGPRVTRRNLGADWRYPIVNKFMA
jgi:NAD+ synthase (glutamine-hydrolysing)